MDKTDNIEVIKAKLYNAETKYSWEQKGYGGKYDHLGIWGMAIFVGCLIFSFFWFVLDELTVDSIDFWGLFAFMTMMVLITRYLYFPDKHRCYHLTSLGIHYTEQDMIPEVAYKIVRGFAWMGIAVCIIAVFVLGPLAFVGAGAFALMAFGMTNFQSTVDKSYVFIDKRSVAFNLVNNSVVSFAIPEKGAHAYSADIYISLEQKEALLNYLRSLFPSIEVVKIKRLNDQYKHPVYQRDEEEAVE
ncbi:hypothetical protein [Vibrio hepatarius]|uniref:hypothetical protein n=1 Tax=Vibrio hepatarius TaxID=171383 RepID=UPI00142D4819|nr:hypothetical protein [Vibrio hepatarius]NIY85413.1 hypothetical protein [Vibrio hepatarius]